MMEFRGVYTIPCTPFTRSGELDLPSLRREVQFCLDCGAHGLVAPVNASEFSSLSDAERKRVVEVVATENAGRVPFVAGVSAVSAAVGVELARHARSAGADALIAMPPYVKKAGEAEIFDYYARIADAADLPVVIQDFIPPIGTPMRPEFMARLLREIPQVRFLKEEAILPGHVMTRTRELAGPALEGTMGGQGGRFLFDEVARGASGTMPACQITDIHVDIWNLIEAGDMPAARALFNRALPLLNFEWMFSVALYKELLRRRGVIETSVCRAAPAELDELDLQELDAILEGVAPLFRVGC
jgi:dihydrodipicolinate synthase/N-acetylneuraminate lyase